MSYASSFLGGTAGPVVSQAKNFGQTNSMPAALAFADPITVLSGAMTAGVEKNILTVNGRGRLLLALMSAVDATARTATPRIYIDGADILGAPAIAFSATDNGVSLVGQLVYGGAAGTVAVLQAIDFRSQLRISLQSSLTETDKLRAHYRYEVWQ